MMAERPFHAMPAKVLAFAPGEKASPADYSPGDFILTHSAGFIPTLIRFGQWLRFHGRDRKYTRWNHAAMIVTSEGRLIEALGHGVVESSLEKYAQTEYHLVKTDHVVDVPADRKQVVGFARWSLDEPYGWVTIVSVALSMLTGCKFNFGFDGQCICSGLVARALERTNAIFTRTPSHISPADLAKYFQVEPPPKGTSKGLVPKN